MQIQMKSWDEFRLSEKIKIRIKNSTLFSILLSIYKGYFTNARRKFGYIHPTAFVRLPAIIKGIENVYLNEYTSILGNATILTTKAKFIMKRNSGAAEGLTVVTGSHTSHIGVWSRFISDSEKEAYMDKDVVVEEDVWIASNVTLLAGVKVGRGSVIGSGSVCRSNIPPYSIVIGNPAKVIGFKFYVDEIIEHEKTLYSEEERLPKNKLEKNYEKYYVKKIDKIVDYIK